MERTIVRPTNYWVDTYWRTNLIAEAFSDSYIKFKDLFSDLGTRSWTDLDVYFFADWLADIQEPIDFNTDFFTLSLRGPSRNHLPVINETAIDWRQADPSVVFNLTSAHFTDESFLFNVMDLYRPLLRELAQFHTLELDLAENTLKFPLQKYAWYSHVQKIDF